MLENSKDLPLRNRNFTEISNLLVQRDMSLFLISRPNGMGYCDIIASSKKGSITIVPKSISHFQWTGDGFPKGIQLFSDFEGANLRDVLAYQEEESINMNISVKSDSNSLGFGDYFCFGIRTENTHGIDDTNNIWERMKKEFESYSISNSIRHPTAYANHMNLSMNNIKLKANDSILISSCVPYSFSELVDFLEKTEENLKSKANSTDYFNLQQRSVTIENEDTFYKKEIIGGTRLGLAVYLLQITSPKSNQFALKYEKRKYILISARQHAAETASSFTCQGIIQFLCSDKPAAKQLKDAFIFLIIPMMNPDGVVIGNSRTNLSGADLNRSWKEPREKIEPEVFYMKEHLKKFFSTGKKELFLFIDLHSSYSQEGAFLIGSEVKEQEGGDQATKVGSTEWVTRRLFAKVIHETNSSLDWKHCSFDTRHGSSSSARIIFAQEMNAKLAYSLVISQHGFQPNQPMAHMDCNPSQEQKNQDNQESENEKSANGLKVFETQDYELLGEDICVSLMKFILMNAMLEEEIVQNNGELNWSKVASKNHGQTGQEEEKEASFITTDNTKEINQEASFSQKIQQFEHDGNLGKSLKRAKSNNKRTLTRMGSSKMNQESVSVSPPPPAAASSSNASKLTKQNSITAKVNKLLQHETTFNSLGSSPTAGKSCFFQQKEQEQTETASREERDDNKPETNPDNNNNKLAIPQLKLFRKEKSYYSQESEYDYGQSGEIIESGSMTCREKTICNDFVAAFSRNRVSTSCNQQRNNSLKTNDHPLAQSTMLPTLTLTPKGNSNNNSNIFPLSNSVSASPSSAQAKKVKQLATLIKNNKARLGSGNSSSTPRNRAATLLKYSSSSTAGTPKKSTQKLSLFYKYIIGRAWIIKALFGEMRSFEWQDYFLQSELVSSNAVMEQKDFDTDSDPEDDLLEGTQIHLRANKKKMWLKQHGNYDEMGNLMNGSLRSFRMNSYGSSKSRVSSQSGISGQPRGDNEDYDDDDDDDDGELFFDGIGYRKGKRNRQQSSLTEGNFDKFSNGQLKNGLNGEETDDIDSADKLRTLNSKGQQTGENQGMQGNNFYKMKTLQTIRSKYLLPKLEFLKIKNPFLPSQKEICEQYSKKCIQSRRQASQSPRKNSKSHMEYSDYTTVTVYEPERYSQPKNQLFLQFNSEKDGNSNPTSQLHVQVNNSNKSLRSSSRSVCNQGMNTNRKYSDPIQAFTTTATTTVSSENRFRATAATDTSGSSSSVVFASPPTAATATPWWKSISKQQIQQVKAQQINGKKHSGVVVADSKEQEIVPESNKAQGDSWNQKNQLNCFSSLYSRTSVTTPLNQDRLRPQTVNSHPNQNNSSQQSSRKSSTERALNLMNSLASQADGGKQKNQHKKSEHNGNSNPQSSISARSFYPAGKQSKQAFNNPNNNSSSSYQMMQYIQNTLSTVCKTSESFLISQTAELASSNPIKQQQYHNQLMQQQQSFLKEESQPCFSQSTSNRMFITKKDKKIPVPGGKIRVFNSQFGVQFIPEANQRKSSKIKDSSTPSTKTILLFKRPSTAAGSKIAASMTQHFSPRSVNTLVAFQRKNKSQHQKTEGWTFTQQPDSELLNTEESCYANTNSERQPAS